MMGKGMGGGSQVGATGEGAMGISASHAGQTMGLCGGRGQGRDAITYIGPKVIHTEVRLECGDQAVRVLRHLPTHIRS